MNREKKPIHDKEEYIDRVFKGETETKLLASNGPLEVLKQTIPRGKEWKLYPFSDEGGFEFFYILEGQIIFTEPGPKKTLNPGDYITQDKISEELWFRTKTDSTLLWFSSKPAFKSTQEQIKSFREVAREVEEMEGMKNHSVNLERISVQIGRKIGLSSEQLYNLHYAAYFHDIGKAKVPKKVLRKEGELSEEEWEKMKNHSTWGREMLEKKDFLRKAAKIVEQHHERVDGTGYPKGLKGEEIPIEAKIISVVDAFDAMRTDRVYRDAISEEEAIKELKNNSGTQFDKEVVSAFLELLKGEEAEQPEEFDTDRAYTQQRKFFLDLGEKVLSTTNIDDILSDLAQAVINTSPFQRSIISLYNRSIDLDNPKKARVIHFSFAGLSREEKEKVKELGQQKPEVQKAKFDSEFRISNSYYIPHGVDLVEDTDSKGQIKSDKSVETMDDWHPDDRLYVPLTKGNKIMGHISVDDPIDGKAPTKEKLQIIEGLANLGSLAIKKTRRIRELNEQKGKLRALYSVGYSFIQANSLEELYNKTTELIGEYLDYEYCTILLQQDGKLESVSRESSLEGEAPLGKGETIEVGKGITGKVAETGEPIMVNAVQEDPRYIQGRDDIRSELSVPIEYEGESIGVIDIQSRSANNFSKGDLELLEIISAQLAIAISNINRKKELKRQATQDPLTGVYNRRYFSSVIESEIERSHRYNHTLAIMMTDINNFKEINDRYSHVTGDRVLVAIASLLQQKTRDADTVVRYGGDEFLILFPETGKEVRTVINRIESGLENWNRENDLIDMELTISSGLSFWFPDGGKDIDEAIKQADRRMYDDKGRTSET